MFIIGLAKVVGGMRNLLNFAIRMELAWIFFFIFFSSGSQNHTNSSRGV